MITALKLRAKRLSPAITKMFGIPVTHSQALELIAQAENYPNWDTASACGGNKIVSNDFVIRVWTNHDEDDARKMAEAIMAQESCGNDSVLLAGTVFLLTTVLLHACYWKQHRGVNLSKEDILVKICDTLVLREFDSNRQLLQWMRGSVHDSEGVMGWLDYSGKPTLSHPGIDKSVALLEKAEDRDLWGITALALRQSLSALKS